MPIPSTQLEQARSTVEAAASVRAAAASLRAQFPGLHAIVVDAMDMRDETPTLSIGQRALFLAASDGHCWSVTADPARASAIILTEG